MNKKGAERTSMRLIYLGGVMVACAIIVFGVMSFIIDAIDDNTFWRNYYAKEMGLGMDLLLASRGEMELEVDFAKFDELIVLWITDDQIMLGDYNPKLDFDEEKKRSSYFRYAKDLMFKPYNSWQKDLRFMPEKLYIKKTDSELIFAVKALEEKTCSGVLTSIKDGEKALVYVKGPDEIRDKIVLGLERQEQIDISNNMRNDLVLGLSIVDDPLMDKEIISYEYFGPIDKAEKLKCLIDNTIIKNSKIITSGFKNMKSGQSVGNAQMGLSIIYNHAENDFSDEIVKGVIEYFS